MALLVVGVLALGALRAGAQQDQATDYAIADGQGSLVQGMVAKGDALPDGWMLAAATVERRRIEVRYRAIDGGDEIVFTLVHPEAPATPKEGKARETERFKLLVPAGPEEAPVQALADALEKSVRAGEADFAWEEVEPPPEPEGAESEGEDDGEGPSDKGSEPAAAGDGDGGGCSCDVLRPR